MTAAVTVDVAGGPMGGAARFRDEFYRYLGRCGRNDVKVIGANRRLAPGWLIRREVTGSARVRQVAVNNVGFVTPGGERWTLLGNALHFLTDAEEAALDPSSRAVARRQSPVVRLAARRSDVLIVPCSDMAERVVRTLPCVGSRVAVRMHPVSADSIPTMLREPTILCPVLFMPYKHMVARLMEWLVAVDRHIDPSIRMLVTASPREVPASLAVHSRIKLVGTLTHADLCSYWARSKAIYFPPGLESFGYPLAEARVSGQPVIARDTAQNREIAGPALCGFTPGDEGSLREATMLALATEVAPDPAPFDPDSYFNWLLGPAR